MMPRDMMENERSSAINPGEAVEEKVSLSDRFGLWLGFHHCSQDDYLAMVIGYAKHFRLDAPVRPARSRGARMGDDARLPLWAHGVAIRPGSRRAARQAARRCERLTTVRSLDTGEGRRAFPWTRRPRCPSKDGLVSRRSSKVRFARQGPGSRPASSEAGEIVRRIDRGRSLAQFEVELRRIDVAGVAGLGDHLPALDLFAALDVELAVVAVSGDEAVGMLDEDEVAVAFQPVARVDDDAALGRPNRGARPARRC